MTDTNGTTRLASIAESYKSNLPADLRDSHSMDWYIDEIIDDTDIARTAAQRLSDMFVHYGREYDEETETMEYKLASEDPLGNGSNQFYGFRVHRAIHDFVNTVQGAARNLSTENTIKVLLGPVGSGKSDFSRRVRRYYEDYTSKDAGRMYTFRWVNLTNDIIPDQDPGDETVMSQRYQDPIVLLPEEERREIFNEANETYDGPYNIWINDRPDADAVFYLDRLLEYYDDDLQTVFDNHVEIVRLIADESQRRCIDTFEPKDKKNQDEAELTGSVDYSKLAVYSESDPRAFDYSGALCNANRGIFYGEELFKLQDEFLYDFLHAAQERTIKPKNNPRMDIDSVILSATNMKEYREKREDESMKAFMDRSDRTNWPYITEYSDEAKVYKKMLRNAHIPDVHVEPHTLDMAAMFVVLSRLQDPVSENVSLIQKARAYDDPGSEPDVDVRKLRREAEGEGPEGIGEGMDGISTRFIKKQISKAIMNEQYADRTSLSALTVLDHIEDNMEKHGSIQIDKLDDYDKYLEMVRDEYKDRAIDDVRNALAYDPEEIQSQGEKYFDHVMAYIDDDMVEDPISGETVNPDEKFMRSVEEQLEIPEDRKDSFRQEVSNWISRRARQGDAFDPKDNDKVRRALEKKLWEDKKHNISFSALVSASEADEEKRSDWIESLKELGYSEEGAKEVLEYAGADVARTEMEDDA